MLFLYRKYTQTCRICVAFVSFLMLNYANIYLQMTKHPDYKYNPDKIFEILNTQLRHIGVREFCQKAKISHSTIYEWGKREGRKGPSKRTLNKIVEVLNSLGVSVVPGDFYLKLYENKELSEVVSEGNLNTTKNEDINIQLIDQLETLNNLLHEKTIIINNQYKEILSLRKKNEELESQIKKP